MLNMTMTGVIAAAAIASGTGLATAHVTVQPTEATAGSYLLLDFNVPHGCQGS